MPKKVLFSTDLREYRPIIWYGEPVHTRYNQLKAILNERLGEQYAGLLSEPVVGQGATSGRGQAHWMTDYVSNGISYTKLNEQQQNEVRQKLSSLINKIKKFATELQTETDQQLKELGELLLLAVEIPALDHIWVEDSRIVLVLWGFNSDKAQEQNFQLSQVLALSEAEKALRENEKLAAQQTPPPVAENKIPIEKQLEKAPVEENSTKKIEPQSTNPPPTPPPPPETKKRRLPAWLWMIIGALIMFILLAICYFLCLQSPNTLPEQGIVPPIDTTQVGIDPDDPAKRKILVDKINVALSKEADLKAFSDKLIAKYSGNLEITYYDTLINLLQLKTPSGEWKQWMDSIKTFEEARLVFSESLFEHAEFTDPGFTNSEQNWYFSTIKAPEAWTKTQGSEDIIVAIIDNGFDLTHPEFQGKIVKPWNVASHSENVFPPAVEGGEHGTHVAATAIGLANNGEGLAGIAPNCKFMPIQLGDENGNMSSLSVVAGILYAIHQEADVINMSLGMMFPPEFSLMPIEEQKELAATLYPDEAIFWDDLYDFAVENNIVIVQAAGNSNIITGIDPSARSKKTIIVAALDNNGERAEFSNFGEMTTITAPGVRIYSAVPNGKFAFLQGTSMASPIVAGAVALVKSVNPDMPVNELIDLMVRTGKIISTDQTIGPLLQLDKLLNADTTLIIPDNPEDLSFAEGSWKSSNDLISTVDESKISLYFDIRKDGNGKLTLVEEKDGGRTCVADLEISFLDGKLIMIQPDNAICDGDGGYYNAYKFECVQGEKGVADCKAIQKDGSGDLIDFKLRKQ